MSIIEKCLGLRKKNIIKVSGNMVYAEDIESIITKNKNILEAAVMGLSDRNGFEKIILCVVSKNKNYSKEKLFEYCQKNLTNFQQPFKILFLKYS